MKNTYSGDFASSLLQIKAIELRPHNPFTWASGRRSPIYCDNRAVLSFPTVRTMVKSALVELAGSILGFDTIAGVATAGIPHGVLLADSLELPFVYVRASSKDHGRQNLIEGRLPSNAKVLVVEDLISTGGSSLKAVDALRQAGAEVIGCLALFSYGFKEAHQAFENAKCPLLTISDYPTLLQEAIKINYINANEADILSAWNQNPVAWHEQFVNSEV